MHETNISVAVVGIFFCKPEKGMGFILDYWVSRCVSVAFVCLF